MAGYGNQVQFEVYQPATESDGLPFSFEEWESKAREMLQAAPYYYVADGAGSGETMLENREAFRRWRLVPRMLCDTDQRDLTVTLFGQKLSVPVLLGPVGVQSIVHSEGELASARAAASIGVPYVASTAASHTIEEIAQSTGNSPHWFQLYWGRDSEVTASMLQRAEKSGYSAIVVTLDTPMLSWREKDLGNAYLPFLQAEGIANYLSDPAFCAGLKEPPEKDIASAVRHFTEIFSNAALTWGDLAFLRKQTSLPILLKGILHPEDASKALAAGVDGMIVSNHGGRQIDGAVSALDALEDVCEVVQGCVPVLMDSGIRRGSDIVKAIALGASAVLIGRPYVYGLAVAGEEGVRRVIRNLLADLDLTMALSGKKNLSEINRSLLTRRSR